MKYITEDQRWVTFYPKFNSSFFIEKAGYFDERPEIQTSVTQIAALIIVPVLIYFSAWFLLMLPFVFFGWGMVFIHLPIRTGIQDCESAAWGFNYHDNKIWIYIGGGGNFEGGKKWKTITMPWQYDWFKTKTLRSDGTWEVEVSGSKKSLWEKKWEGIIHKETHPYTYVLNNGTIQNVNATIGVRIMEWRMRWFKSIPIFRKVCKSIDVDFDAEVGERTGSWKGGTIGCGYDMKGSETPLECLRRMELERKF